MKFQVGDTVTCCVPRRYNITDVGVLCTVERVSGTFMVSVDHRGELVSYEVNPDHFTLVKRGDDERIIKISSLDYESREELDLVDKLLIEEAIKKEMFG